MEQSSSKADWPTIENDLDLQEGKISFHTKSNHHVVIKSVWQDTRPGGSSVGTVFAIHGSPGSHNDFKYIAHHLKETGIRMIAINMPGHGYTQNHKKIKFHNEDRDAFIQSMLAHLRIEGDIIFMGHSRGTENTLNICTMNRDRTKGMILVNATGFRMHKGIKPYLVIQAASFFCNIRPRALQRALVHPTLYFVYRKLYRMKIKNGKTAAVCVQTQKTYDFSKQKEQIETLNRETKFPILLAFGGRDFLIEEEIGREMLSEFENSDELVLKESRSEVAEWTASQWFQDNLPKKRTLGVCFKQDGHFLQKFKAKFISDAIIKMCEPGQEQ